MDVVTEEENKEEKKCLICNQRTNDGEGAVSIFNKTAQTCSDRPLNFVMSQILAQSFDKKSVHSDLMCKSCFENFNEVDELERKLQQQKIDLLNKYKKSLKESENSEKPENLDNVPVTEETILNLPSTSKVSEKKIIAAKENLDVIDDNLDAIEDQLEKMHGGAELELKDPEKLANLNSKPAEALAVQLEVAESDTSMAADAEESILKQEIGDADVVELMMGSEDESLDEEEFKMFQEKLAQESALVIQNGSLYTCMLCEGDETVCGKKNAIAQHIADVHEREIYFCKICGDSFAAKVILQEHMQSHTSPDDTDYQCEICHRIYNSGRLFDIHRRTHCIGSKTWKCDACGKAYSSQKLLQEHINTHTGVRPYKCEKCDKTFYSKYTFKAHEKTHIERTRSFHCSLCSKSFLTHKNLLQHEKIHVGVKDYPCHLCDKRFSSMNNLDTHSIVHTGYKPYVCGTCGKAFARRAEIKDHERTHTGEKPYQCDICGMKFTQRSNLLSHKRATHFNDKRYKCSKCDKGFKRRRLLDYHIKSAHTGERPYKCTVCNATFVYPEHFKKHRRIHTGERPFKCEICHKAFNNRDNRNAHRFVHSDKKPYECLVCGAGFMRKPVLYQHMQNEGHLNDTIIVNQPRLSDGQETIVMLRTENDIEILQEEDEQIECITEEQMEGNTKVYEVKPVIIAKTDGNELILGDNGEESQEEFILDVEEAISDPIEENEEEEADEDTIIANIEDFEGILTQEAIDEGHTQIIQTKDGPIRLLAVKIPNENGEEEEAWIKILPETELMAVETE